MTASEPIAHATPYNAVSPDDSVDCAGGVLTGAGIRCSFETAALSRTLLAASRAPTLVILQYRGTSPMASVISGASASRGPVAVRPV